MQALYDVPAPAKLNLFLHITGRRADGYHLLQSAFMLIDWHDTLHFEIRHAGPITRGFFAARGTAVHQVAEDLQGLLDNVMGRTALGVRHEPEAAGVMLLGGIV